MTKCNNCWCLLEDPPEPKQPGDRHYCSLRCQSEDAGKPKPVKIDWTIFDQKDTKPCVYGTQTASAA